MFEGTVAGVPRPAGEAYMSLRDPYGSPRGQPAARPGPATSIARSRSFVPPARRSRGAGELEPDAGAAAVAVDAPAVGHLVDEHQPEAARLELAERGLALARDAPRAPGVADLDPRELVVAAGHEPDRLVALEARGGG